MRTWANELLEHTHNYVRRGGKHNRQKQVALIVDFLEYTDSHEKITSLHRLGTRHVVNFWKAHRNLSEKTAYDYWLGICKLWEWLGKPGKPPKPHKQFEAQEKPRQQQSISPDIATALRSARESQSLTVLKLANMAGCEAALIESLEAGKSDSLFPEIQGLLRALNIKFYVGQQQ
jgi:hypothetical protein